MDSAPPPDPLTIVVVNDLYGPSSAAGIAVSQARRFQEQGHDVHFIATVQERGAARDFVEEGGMRVSLLYSPPYSLRFRAWKSLWNRAALRAFRERLDQIDPDVVHFHNVHIHLSYRALKVAKDRSIPVVLSVHDVMPFCFQKMFCFLHDGLKPDGPKISFKAPMPRCIPCARFRYNPFRNPFIRYHFSHYVDRLLAVSDEMKRALNENNIGNVATIENGIDPRAASSDEDGTAFRERHGLVDRKVVLYGGRLDHRKGAEHLIRAMVKIKQRTPAAALLVVGSGLGGYEGKMLELAKELGIGDDVVCSGWLDQAGMAEAYAACDVICTPSLIFESFGLINAEGMLRGKPSVTSYFGGPADVVEDGVSGYHVNPLDVDALAERLGSLLASDALRQQMGEAARERVLERFHLDHQSEKTEALYRSLLAESRS